MPKCQQEGTDLLPTFASVQKSPLGSFCISGSSGPHTFPHPPPQTAEEGFSLNLVLKLE